MKKSFMSAAVVFFMLVLSSGMAFGAGSTATYEKAARRTAGIFMQKLGKDLKKEMKFGGAAGAIRVCSNIAPSMARQLSLKNGWKVTRVGTRVRDPLLGMPDAWEQKVLEGFQKRAAKGEDIDKMSYFDVVTEPNGKKYFRYMKAIAVKPVCLACHGPKEQIAPAVLSFINKRYPHDMATGYRVGDLRGAISIKGPIR